MIITDLSLIDFWYYLQSLKKSDLHNINTIIWFVWTLFFFFFQLRDWSLIFYVFYWMAFLCLDIMCAPLRVNSLKQGSEVIKPFSVIWHWSTWALCAVPKESRETFMSRKASSKVHTTLLQQVQVEEWRPLRNLLSVPCARTSSQTLWHWPAGTISVSPASRLCGKQTALVRVLSSVQSVRCSLPLTSLWR